MIFINFAKSIIFLLLLKFFMILKKLFLGFALFAFMHTNAQSVEKPNRKSKVIGHDDVGSLMINSGLGVNSQEALPFYINTEFFFINELSFGVQLLSGGYKFVENGWSYKTTNLAVGGLLNYHINTLLNISYKWDFYIGGSAGFTLPTVFPDNWNAPSATNEGDKGLYYFGQAGVRYFIWEHLGLNAEAFYGNFKKGANFGLTIKF
jgi:hypothetical protein